MAGASMSPSAPLIQPSTTLRAQGSQKHSADHLDNGPNTSTSATLPSSTLSAAQTLLLLASPSPAAYALPAVDGSLKNLRLEGPPRASPLPLAEPAAPRNVRSASRSPMSSPVPTSSAPSTTQTSVKLRNKKFRPVVLFSSDRLPVNGPSEMKARIECPSPASGSPLNHSVMLAGIAASATPTPNWTGNMHSSAVHPSTSSSRLPSSSAMTRLASLSSAPPTESATSASSCASLSSHASKRAMVDKQVGHRDSSYGIPIPVRRYDAPTRKARVEDPTSAPSSTPRSSGALVSRADPTTSKPADEVDHSASNPSVLPSPPPLGIPAAAFGAPQTSTELDGQEVTVVYHYQPPSSPPPMPTYWVLTHEEAEERVMGFMDRTYPDHEAFTRRLVCEELQKNGMLPKDYVMPPIPRRLRKRTAAPSSI